MKAFFKLIILTFVVSIILVSCAKKPLTLGDETPMKVLLKASDEELTELFVQEASEKANLSREDIKVEYILRDEKSQTIVVKSKIKE